MFSFDEDRFYTMPPFFGGSPVRRKIALLDCQGVSLTVETDPGAVGKILPEGFEMERPEINLSFEHCASPSWLEGRDINIASAGVPVRYTGNDEGLSGMLLLAVWIDEFSTVTALREETGTPAMYADISLSKPGGSIFTASLGGKQPFLRVDFTAGQTLDAEQLQAINASIPSRSFCWRYIPNVGGPGAALSHAVLSPSLRTVTEGSRGEGNIVWQRENFRAAGQQNVLSALSGLVREGHAGGYALRGSLHFMPELARPLP